MAKKAPNPLTGRWRIVSMSAWEDEYPDEEVQDQDLYAYFLAEDDGGK